MMMWTGPKGSEGRGLLETKEDLMNLITRHELAKLSLDELRGHYRRTFNLFATAPRGSDERCQALASLQNIEREIQAREP